MAINRIPVDPEWQSHLRAVIDVMPVVGFDFDKRESTGVQSIDQTTGYPMWEIAVAVKVQEDRKADTIFVRVPHPTRPDCEGERVVFGGLECDKPAYANKRGENVTVDSAWKFTARTVGSATAPSARRPAVPTAENGKTPAATSA